MGGVSKRFQKRPPDALDLAIDFDTRVRPGVTVVASNARGSLSVVATDSAGTDVSATLLEGAPWIENGTQVAFWLVNGVEGPYYSIEASAPTSDGQLITERVLLEVLP